MFMLSILATSLAWYSAASFFVVASFRISGSKKACWRMLTENVCRLLATARKRLERLPHGGLRLLGGDVRQVENTVYCFIDSGELLESLRRHMNVVLECREE